MRHYYFAKYGTLMRDDHPFAIYAGKKRLSPPPVFAWWWPINWVAIAILAPVVAYDYLIRRKRL